MLKKQGEKKKTEDTELIIPNHKKKKRNKVG